MVATRPIEAEDDVLDDTGGHAEERWEFDSLFRLHARRLMQVAWLMTSDRNEAEDVVAEVFARVYRKPPTGVENPIGYLRRAVVNEVIGRTRSAARRRSLFSCPVNRESLRCPLSVIPMHGCRRSQNLPDDFVAIEMSRMVGGRAVPPSRVCTEFPLHFSNLAGPAEEDSLSTRSAPIYRR